MTFSNATSEIANATTAQSIACSGGIATRRRKGTKVIEMSRMDFTKLPRWAIALFAKRPKELNDSKRKCFECDQWFDRPDDLAIHLIDEHCWDSERARLWLRDTIEEQAFNNEP
jgi:hypothetical protein